MSTNQKEYLFKYRGPDLGRLEKIINSNEIWASDPNSFNDPFDCLPYIDESVNYKDAVHSIKDRLRKMGKFLTEDQIRSYALTISKGGLKSFLDGEDPVEFFRNSMSQFGIISFAECAKNILMWSHYGKDHTGVCLEFSTGSLPFSKAKKISYVVERPIFRPLAPKLDDLADRILLRKATAWEYEKEWRYVKISPGPVKFEPKSLTAIIFGAAAKPEFKEQVKDMISSIDRQIALKQCRFDEKDYILHID